jgi:hypothetical protein
LTKNTAGLQYEKCVLFPKPDAVWDKFCTRIRVATQAEKIIIDKNLNMKTLNKKKNMKRNMPNIRKIIKRPSKSHETVPLSRKNI